MPTNYTGRVLIVCPADKVAAFNTWLKANIDLTGGNWLTLNLSASGLAPATHAWANAALTGGELKQMMIRLCQLAGIGAPPNWDTMNRPQQIDWMKQQRPTIYANTGIWVAAMLNEAQWDDPEAVLAAGNLKVIA